MERREFVKGAVAAPAALALGSRLIDSRAWAVGAGAPAGDAAAAATTLVVPIIGRRAWGAMKPRRGRERHRPVRLTLHHSAVRLKPNSDAPAHIRAHQDWHMNGNGKPDIDYHFVIDRHGFVYQGRNTRFRGDTQTEYDPTGHFLICCDGDYEGVDGPAQRAPKAMLRSVARVFAWAVQRWDIDPGSLGGHRNYAHTTCPGDNLQRYIRNGVLERRIRNLAARRTIELDVLPPRRGRALVRRIESGAV